jgi:hypothetical protein
MLLEPVSAGQTRFRLQGLAADTRGIAVGRDALVVFDTLDQLVAFLGAYSDEASLDDLLPTLTLERAQRGPGGQVLLVRCATGDGWALDRVARLAGAARGRTYAGAGRVFVRTRERAAPFGYDLASSVAELGLEADVVASVEHDQVAAYRVVERFDPLDLVERLSLRRVPLTSRAFTDDPELAGLRDLALVLVAPGLADRVLRWLWTHDVTMAGVRVVLDDERAPALLLRLRQPSTHVLSVLHGLPGVELFTVVSPRVAIEVGFRHPIHLSTANACFPGDEMLLFRGTVNRVERIDGAPRFVDGRRLVRLDPSLRLGEVGRLATTQPIPLDVDLRLEPSSDTREPMGALIAWEQLGLLRQLVYLLPPMALASAVVLPLEEGLLILARRGVSGGWSGAWMATSLVPLGRRYVEAAPGVLVPDGWELVPHIRAALLRTLLGLDADDCAVFLALGREPLRVRSSDLRALDASLLARIELSEPVLVAASATQEPPPARIEPDRMGRFALWGFRGSAR